MPGSEAYWNPSGFWQIKCDICRVVYGYMLHETDAVEAAKVHVHRIELTRTEVKWQRIAATDLTYKP